MIEESGNQNKNENQTANKPEVASEPMSTIFAAPEQKDDRKVKKSNRTAKIAVSGTVALVLTAVIVLVAIFVPKIVNDDEKNPDITITLAQNEADDVSKVTLIKGDDATTFYSEVEITEMNGESKRYVTWFIEDIAQRLIDSDKVESLVNRAATLKAVRDMGADTGAFGLDNPKYVLTVTSRDDVFEPYTVTVGDESPDKSGNYAKISGNENVYLIGSEYAEQYSKVITDYADTTAVKKLEMTDENEEYFENEKLVYCDKIVLNNSSFSAPLTFVPNDSEATETFASFLITSPVNRYANKVNELLNIAGNGLVGDGVYVFNPTDSDIESYGLNNPTATLDIYIGETVVSLKAATAPDENYFAVIDQDKEAIYKVFNNSLSFATNSMSYYYNQFLTMEMLSSLSDISINLNGQTYDFGVTYYEELSDGEDFDIILNGEELNQTNFQNYYQVFLGLQIIDYSTADIKTEPTFSITMKHQTKTVPDTVLKLYKYSDQRYIATVNGQQQGLISNSAVDKLIDYTNRLVNGEEVPAT